MMSYFMDAAANRPLKHIDLVAVGIFPKTGDIIDFIELRAPADGIEGPFHTHAATNLELLLNRITQNTADGNGGGAIFGQSAGLVQWNWVIGNTTPGGGGGINVFGPSTDLTLHGNWIEGNEAGAGFKASRAER